MIVGSSWSKTIKKWWFFMQCFVKLWDFLPQGFGMVNINMDSKGGGPKSRKTNLLTAQPSSSQLDLWSEGP